MDGLQAAIQENSGKKQLIFYFEQNLCAYPKTDWGIPKWDST